VAGSCNWIHSDAVEGTKALFRKLGVSAGLSIVSWLVMYPQLDVVTGA
jgi:hypothetical protein